MRLHTRDVRQDVRELGALLGDVLEAQTSTAAFETVEELRTAAIDHRSGDLDSRAPLRAVIDDLDATDERVVARAFTTSFELINLAEERERVRAIREASQSDSLADGLAATVDEPDEAGADAAAVRRVLDDVLIEPTFTAHPTEARRKTVKSQLRAIGAHLEALDERRLTGTEFGQRWRAVDAEVTSLWGTRQVRERPPEPRTRPVTSSGTWRTPSSTWSARCTTSSSGRSASGIPTSTCRSCSSSARGPARTATATRT